MTKRPWITSFGRRTPDLHPEAWVDVSARIVGAVTMEAGASVWPMAVLRSEEAGLTIGRRSAVLDLALVEAPVGHPVLVEEGSIISHGAMIHGAMIRTGVLIGIGAIVLDGADIGRGTIVGAGALIPPGRQVPPNSLVLGAPGKIVRQTTDRDRETIAAQVTELYEKSRRMLKS